jgi:hypothetical protein
MHLQGVERILSSIGLQPASGAQGAYQTHLVEVMGVMDLPVWTLGRQNPCLGVWKRNCAPRGFLRHNRDQVEAMSGLPKSLLDVISDMDSNDSELQLWNWPGAHGSLAQTHLWEAYRLACILTHRQCGTSIRATCTASATFPVGGQVPTGTAQGSKAPISTELLVTRIVSSLDAVEHTLRPSSETAGSTRLPTNALLYPAVIAALQADIFSKYTEYKDVVRRSLRVADEPKIGEQSSLLLDLVEEIWQELQDHGGPVNVDDILRARGLELSLL